MSKLDVSDSAEMKPCPWCGTIDGYFEGRPCFNIPGNAIYRYCHTTDECVVDIYTKWYSDKDDCIKDWNSMMEAINE